MGYNLFGATPPAGHLLSHIQRTLIESLLNMSAYKKIYTASALQTSCKNQARKWTNFSPKQKASVSRLWGINLRVCMSLFLEMMPFVWD